VYPSRVAWFGGGVKVGIGRVRHSLPCFRRAAKRRLLPLVRSGEWGIALDVRLLPIAHTTRNGWGARISKWE
jgi:hypothetical protein